MAFHRDGNALSIAFTVTLVIRPGEQRPHAIAAVIRDDTARRRELGGLGDLLATLEARVNQDPDDHGEALTVQHTGKRSDEA